MAILKRIKQAIPEFNEQAAIVSSQYGGGKFRWLVSMAWCLLRYGARPIDYARFEFHKKSSRERNRYLTIYRYFRVEKHFGAGSHGVSGKVEEYRTFGKFIKRNWLEVNKSTPTSYIDEFISKYEEIIAKPVNGEQGKSIKYYFRKYSPPPIC